MKKYETPQIEEVKVQIEDVIATSGENLGDWLGDDKGEWPYNY